MVAEAVVDKPVALEDSGVQELSQGILFPVDEDEAKLVDVGDMYESLSEQQRQLVRGYMKGVRRHGADFQMKHWAEYSGLPKSTFYDRLKTGDMVKVAAATREAMVLTGQHDCARAALVMGKAVLFIERLVDEGKAKVEDLAKAPPQHFTAGLDLPGREQVGGSLARNQNRLYHHRAVSPLDAPAGKQGTSVLMPETLYLLTPPTPTPPQSPENSEIQIARTLPRFLRAGASVLLCLRAFRATGGSPQVPLRWPQCPQRQHLRSEI